MTDLNYTINGMGVNYFNQPWTQGAGASSIPSLPSFIVSGIDSPSYIVWTDGTYYYAKNARTGNVDYGGATNNGSVSGQNVAAVIQAAINAINTNGGGDLIIKAGAYTWTQAVTLNNMYFIRIVAEYGAYLTRNANVQFFIVSGTSHDITFENLTFNGGGIGVYGQAIIDCQNGYHLRFIKLNMHDGGANGINISGTSCYDAHFQSCMMVNFTGNGIDASDGNPKTDIFMANCVFFNCALGASIANAVSVTIISCETDTASGSTLGFKLFGCVGSVLDCDFEGTAVTGSNTHGIWLNNSDFLIAGNRFYHCGNGGSTAFPIYIDGASSSCTIVSNQFAVTISYADLTCSGAVTKATVGMNRWASGQAAKWENWGTSSGTGAQQTIAHGLWLTPTRIFLSEGTTGGALAYQSAAANGTNIFITAVSGKTYSWYASCLPTN